MSDLWRATTPDAVNISDNFSQREFAAALQHLNPGKAPGPDSICPKLILHARAALKSWLCDFISSCLRRLKIPKIWRRVLVVTIPKPGKPMGDPKSYRPISLLCVPYKILERLIYTCVEPLIDPLLPKEQAWFQCRNSTVDQVVLLTQNIEDSFEAKKKASAIFIDLTAAYDTLWHHGLTCKLLRLLPDKHMVKMIMELVRNRSFTLTTGDSKQSRLRHLKNGVPQGSVLAPLLFNIYTYDLPSMISRKFAYADDLALLHSYGNWKDLEGTLSQDMSTLSAYLQTWRLKLSHTKTVTAAFHLNNQEAKHELKVYNNGRLLLFCPTPTYLGVKLDRSLTFRHHLVALHRKLSSCVTLLRQLVGSGWDAGAKTLCIATLSLVYSTAQYCAPVWYRSAHTRLIDSVLNDALRMVTGWLRPTPMDYLPLRHLASWALPNGSDTLLGLPWISGPQSYLVWSFKWVLRYSPSETKIQMPVCARCVESFGQPCQTWHPCLWMDKSQIENGVLWKCFQAPCFCAQDRCQACWDGLSPSSLG